MRFIAILITFLISFNISEAQNKDIELLRKIYNPSTLPSDNFFQFVSNSTSTVMIATPIVMGLNGFIKKDTIMFKHACFLVLGSGLNAVITYGLKYGIDRERPYETYPDIVPKQQPEDSPSFPSGHTSGAFTTATYISLAYPKWYVIAPAYAWATTVGYSRMHLGVHYPSDVFAGALIGAGSAFLSYKVNKWYTNKYEQKHTKHKGRF